MTMRGLPRARDLPLRQTFNGHQITHRDVSALQMLSACPEGSGTINGIMDHNQAHRLLSMRLATPGTPDKVGERYILTTLGHQLISDMERMACSAQSYSQSV